MLVQIIIWMVLDPVVINFGIKSFLKSCEVNFLFSFVKRQIFFNIPRTSLNFKWDYSKKEKKDEHI